MKLRTQFILLVAGIIFVPFLVTASVLLLQYFLVVRGVRVESLSGREVHSPAELARRRPPGSDVVVFGPDNTILHSTVPQFMPGQPADQGEILRFLRENPRASLLHVDPPEAQRLGEPGGEGALVLLLRMPRPPAAPLWFRRRNVEIAVYISLALLVFSSLASFFIVRRFNLAILKLEGATRRIAEGNLDFELVARGSDEVSSLTRSFEHMRRALKEEYARRARFIMGISHDLKTPLALIQGYVEAVADGYAADPQAQKRYLAIIADKTRTLEGMIAELIEFVKMETGEWRMTFRPLRLRAFLADLARRYAEDARILRREFSAELDLSEELEVPADEALVSRALENLLGNAIRYTAEGGRITLSGRRQAQEVLVAIADTGIGIPAQELGRIFDPFYRGTNSRREPGFGLGLSTVKSIIEGHGWRIEVSSALERGTVFTIRIPAQ